MAATIRGTGTRAAARAGGAVCESAPLSTFALGEEHREETLAFLDARPVHTVFAAGCLRDNGVVSPLNRGRFHGCRDASGRLAGVALVGHATLVEARSPAAVAALARAARGCASLQLVRGEVETVGTFWRHYAAAGRRPPRVWRELLYERDEPSADDDAGEARELRRATAADLDLVLAVNDAMAFETCGVSPAGQDPVGFRVRTARRIEQGRVWVWREGGRLVFKADVVSETPGAAYLEGVHVHPQDRGRGHGSRCLARLTRELLARTGVVCLTVLESSAAARAFYEKSGYRFRCVYDTIYL
jgi:hypothetical protein